MSVNWENGKDSFEKFQDIWDKALEKGIFTTGEIVKERDADFFGINLEETPETLNENQVNGWKEMLTLNDKNFFGNNVINEDSKKSKKKVSKETNKEEGENIYKDKMFKATPSSKKVDKDRENLKTKWANLANNPNPVYDDTYGSDTSDDAGQTKVSDGLAASDDLEEIIGKLLKSYETQSEILDKKDMLTAGVNFKKGKEVLGKVSKINKDIEKIHRNMQGNKATDQETE
jgi:hypothetical protein